MPSCLSRFSDIRGEFFFPAFPSFFFFFIHFFSFSLGLFSCSFGLFVKRFSYVWLYAKNTKYEIRAKGWVVLGGVYRSELIFSPHICFYLSRGLLISVFLFIYSVIFSYMVFFFFFFFAVEELTCLAWWKDGSMKYMVGKLEHKMTSSDEDRYRCFVWNNSPDNRVYNVAQSGDATCNGLPSATEGSRTMRLTQGK